MIYEGEQQELPMMVDIVKVTERALVAADEVAPPDSPMHLGRALEQTEQLPLTPDQRALVTDEIMKRHDVSERALRRQKLFSGTVGERVVKSALERLVQRGIPTVTEPSELLQQYKTKRAIVHTKRLAALTHISLRGTRPNLISPPPSPTHPSLSQLLGR